jgi:hypothetical protein
LSGEPLAGQSARERWLIRLRDPPHLRARRPSYRTVSGAMLASASGSVGSSMAAQLGTTLAPKHHIDLRAGLTKTSIAWKPGSSFAASRGGPWGAALRWIEHPGFGQRGTSSAGRRRGDGACSQRASALQRAAQDALSRQRAFGRNPVWQGLNRQIRRILGLLKEERRRQ